MDNSTLTPEERNERFVRYAVTEFEKSLRIMIRDKSPIHLFDFNGTKDGVTELWSFLIVTGRKSELEDFERAIGIVPRPPIREEGEAGKKPS